MTFRRRVDGRDVGGVSSGGAARLFFGIFRRRPAAFERTVFWFLMLVVPAGAWNMVLGQHSHASGPPPSMPQAHASAPAHNGASSGSAHPNPQQKVPGQQHLNEWLKQNQGLSTQEQLNRLQHEPGFNRLPADQQQRLTERLRQVDQMPPQQRQRVLERVENMERLSPQQQQAVRSSASRLRQLPQNRQQAVYEAIRSLRDVPPPYRQSQLYSPRYASQLSPEERGIVGNLLTVESYHPPAAPPRP